MISSILSCVLLSSTALALPQGGWDGEAGWGGHGRPGWGGHGPGRPSGWGPPGYGPPGHGPPGHGPQRHGLARALHFLDNDPAGSSVVSIKLAEDGTLSDPKRTSTDGTGSIAINATSGMEVPVDSLQSQSSVFASKDYLFTVNAGSNTLAVFQLNHADPSDLALLGTPVDTLGEFPVSVTYSEKIQTACVLNGGAKAGVSCFKLDPTTGLQPSSTFRSFAAFVNETTPPHGPPFSSSNILFNPDSTLLLALQKESPGPPVIPGHIAAFAVENGEVSQTFVDNQFGNVALPFAGVFLNQSSVFVADPSYGGSIYRVDDDGHLTQESHSVVASQKAVCWSNYDVALDTVYLIDAGQPVVYTISPSSGALTGQIEAQAAVGGFFDTVIDNGISWSLAAANGIVSLDLAAQKQVGFYNLTDFGVRQHYQGMAITYGGW